MAQLPPVSFQQPQPTLVQQAFTGLLSAYAQRKLITEPLLKQQAKQEHSQQVWNYELGLRAQEQAEKRQVAAEQRAAAHEASNRVWDYEWELRRLEGAKSFERAQPPSATLAGIVPGLIHEAGLKPEDVPAPGYEAEQAKEIDTLTRLGELVTRRKASEAQRLERTSNRANVLLSLAASVPSLLVTENGKDRLALPSEQAAYAIGTTGVGDVLQQYGDDPDTQAVVRDYQTKFETIGRQNFKLAPQFDATVFNAYLDKLVSARQGDAVEFTMLVRAGEHLYNMGMLKDDAQNPLSADLLAEGQRENLVAALEGGTMRQRLSGYLLAQQVFPTREAFKAYELTASPYQFSPVQRETMEAVWGGNRPAPAVKADTTYVDKDRGTGAANTPPPARAPAPAFVAPQARQFAETHKSLAGVAATWAQDFARAEAHGDKPQAMFNQRFTQINAMFSGPKEQVHERLKAAGFGAELGGPSNPALTMRYGLPSPNLAALQLNLLGALRAAWQDYEARRPGGTITF
jgi:hypothetical protein